MLASLFFRPLFFLLLTLPFIRPFVQTIHLPPRVFTSIFKLCTHSRPFSAWRSVHFFLELCQPAPYDTSAHGSVVLTKCAPDVVSVWSFEMACLSAHGW